MSAMFLTANTLDLAEAAAFLKCSEDTVREMAAAGEIPAAKIGRAWVFVDVDLIEFVRSQYPTSKGSEECHSTSAEKRGGSTSPMTDDELDDLLAKPTSAKRRKSTTRLKLISGKNKSQATP